MKKLISLAIIIILVFILKNILFSIGDLIKNESTVHNLEKEFLKKSLENKFLSERLKYVKSDKFIESEAREKLGLSRDGEIVVLFPLKKESQEFTRTTQTVPNWKLWLNLFL